MPIPGLTDVYEFGDWAKRNGIKKGQSVSIVGELGGLITVSVNEPPTREQRDKISDETLRMLHMKRDENGEFVPALCPKCGDQLCPHGVYQHRMCDREFAQISDEVLGDMRVKRIEAAE